jgi:hypothetical protein
VVLTRFLGRSCYISYKIFKFFEELTVDHNKRCCCVCCVKEFVCDGKTRNFFPFLISIFVLLLADISSSFYIKNNSKKEKTSNCTALIRHINEKRHRFDTDNTVVLSCSHSNNHKRRFVESTHIQLNKQNK